MRKGIFSSGREKQIFVYSKRGQYALEEKVPLLLLLTLCSKFTIADSIFHSTFHVRCTFSTESKGKLTLSKHARKDGNKLIYYFTLIIDFSLKPEAVVKPLAKKLTAADS